MDHLRSYMSIITYPSEYIQEQILKDGSRIFLFILNYGQPLRMSIQYFRHTVKKGRIPVVRIFQNIFKHRTMTIVLLGEITTSVLQSHIWKRLIQYVLVHFRRYHWCMAQAFLFKAWFIIKNLKISQQLLNLFLKRRTFFVWEYLKTLKQLIMTILLFGETSLPQYKAT